MADRIQIRRDTDADWTSNDPTLSAGELGYVSDTDELVVGDGSTAYTSLQTFRTAPIEDSWTATDRTTSASEGSYVSHTTTATVTNPGYPVKVFALQTINVSKGPAVAAVSCSFKLQVSLDGGSTWTDGQTQTIGIPTGVDNSSAAVFAYAAGTPTGAVQVRLQSQRTDAATGTVNANGQGGFVRVVRNG